MGERITFLTVIPWAAGKVKRILLRSGPEVSPSTHRMGENSNKRPKGISLLASPVEVERENERQAKEANLAATHKRWEDALAECIRWCIFLVVAAYVVGTIVMWIISIQPK